MKFIKHFLLAVTIIAITASCNTKNTLEFNEKLVNIQQELLGRVNKMEADTSSNALAKLQAFQSFAKTKRDEAKALQAPEGGEAFKEAMVNDISGVVESYDLLIKITQAEGDEAKLLPLREEFAVWEKKIEKLDENVLEEQRKFAKANRITLK